ncbi:hypothetical protein CANARDRAFT_28871 [[Candida] arabinofermentans NRRL YB-2248]|uniref:Uncharacterized protein n=1 Tax=[Candida] arabinofermentans NRRL YB-2248 TaxID=983967 RepID=A0A1E4SYY6_9ASCO|nr:hypothetical protein CANARDRAFT_28871 [[Candida] arabinofermentans NRRL YB-2248]
MMQKQLNLLNISSKESLYSIIRTYLRYEFVLDSAQPTVIATRKHTINLVRHLTAITSTCERKRPYLFFSLRLASNTAASSTRFYRSVAFRT